MKLHEIIFSDEITLWWDKEWDLPDTHTYRATLTSADGEEEKTCKSTHVTFAPLAAECAYKVKLVRVTADGDETEIANITLHTPPAKRRIDVTAAPYFAKGDGTTLNTAALQRALDDCTADACVYFPKGTYLSGALCVHSDTEILLDEGATLQGSEKEEDYLPFVRSRYEGIEMECYRSLLNMGTLDHASGANCENIVIRGKGAILGGGAVLSDAMIAAERARIEKRCARDAAYAEACAREEILPWRVRGRLVSMNNCAHAVIANLTLGYAACWNVHFVYSQDIVTYGCHIKSRGVWNGDGWNPDSSTDCTVFDCLFETHDNCIAVKSGKNPEGNVIARPAERIRVFDCRGGRCMALGSEMSGGVENVYVWDCDFSTTESGFGVKITPKRGAYVRHCRIRNCRFTRVTMRNIDFNDDGEGGDCITRVHDLHFENISLTGNAIGEDGQVKPISALWVLGSEGKEHYFENITFDGVHLEKRCDGKSQLLEIKNVKNFRLDRVSYE